MQVVRHLFSALVAFAIATVAEPAGAARPIGDDVRSAAAVAPTLPINRGVPGDAETAALVRETIELFVRSVAARDMSTLRAEAAVTVQRQLSVAEINDTFRPFFFVDLGPEMLSGLAPIVSDSRPVGADGLVVEGRFESEPQPLAFRLSFVREGLVWRWSYIHVALLPVGAEARN